MTKTLSNAEDHHAMAVEVSQQAMHEGPWAQFQFSPIITGSIYVGEISYKRQIFFNYETSSIVIVVWNVGNKKTWPIGAVTSTPRLWMTTEGTVADAHAAFARLSEDGMGACDGFRRWLRTLSCETHKKLSWHHKINQPSWYYPHMQKFHDNIIQMNHHGITRGDCPGERIVIDDLEPLATVPIILCPRANTQKRAH